MEAQAKTKMVSDIMQGALTGLGAYKQGVAAEKNFQTTRAAVEDPNFQKMYGLDSKSGAKFGTFLDTMYKNQGVEATNNFTKSFMPSLFDYSKMTQQIQAQQRLPWSQYGAQSFYYPQQTKGTGQTTGAAAYDPSIVE
jgi:hypothetical protein